jgi:hypothetical protein
MKRGKRVLVALVSFLLVFSTQALGRKNSVKPAGVSIATVWLLPSSFSGDWLETSGHILSGMFQSA